jgi:drug/metabolite transporter (DMT)-like permease
LPLGDAASILFSSPAWATVMAFFILGEKIDA